MRNVLLALLTLAAPALRAGENPRAARSVHLAWQAPEVTSFYLEMAVDESVPGSYFMACGFDRGYFGIQELGGGRKVALFSIWDPTTGDNPGAVPLDQQVEVLARGPEVRIRRFGGEGTGGQSMRDFAWSIGQTNRFLVEARADATTTTYSAWIHDPAAGQWSTMAVFRTRTRGHLLRGLYSFVEDFRRDGRSVEERRSARYFNGWVRMRDGTWRPLAQAAFSADGNVHTNIDAGAASGRFHLATGGATTMSRALWSRIDIPPPGGAPPADLPP